MLSVPEGVSPNLVRQLKGFQDQIIVLINNHRILQQRVNKSPENSVRILEQIQAVESFLLDLNKEQQPVIEAIRVEIKNLKGNQVGQAEDVKERPKIRGYRGFRGGRRRGDASSRRPTRTPTPESVDDPGGNGNDKGALLLGPGQFKAHVEEVDKKKYDSPIEQPKDLDDPDYPIKLRETTFRKVEKNQFLRHLDLLTDSDVLNLDSYHGAVKKRKLEYRNLTYIPEMTEKKQRVSYSWLSTDQLTSPPLLRTRQRHNHLSHLDKIKPRTRSNKWADNSRASSPLSVPEEVAEEEEEEEEDIEEEEEEECRSMVLEEEEEVEKARDNRVVVAVTTEATAEEIVDEILTAPEEKYEVKNDQEAAHEKEATEAEKPPQQQQVLPDEKPKRERTLTEKQRAKVKRNKTNAESHLKRLQTRLDAVNKELNGDGSKFTVKTRKERIRRNELEQAKANMEKRLEKQQRLIAQYEEQLS